MGRQFTLTDIKALPIYNELDYTGQLLSLERLPNESNAAYRRRILSIFTERANSTQTGLINGMTRDLGLFTYEAITIGYVGSSDKNPYILVKDTEIYLYSNWNLLDENIDPNVLDATIDIYSRDSDAYYFSGLVTEINKLSNFSAALKTGIVGRTPSACLLQQSNHLWVFDEELSPHKINKLKNQNIMQGSMRFSDVIVFNEQVSSEAEVDAAGKYYVDYSNGAVVSYNMVKPGTTCQYASIKTSFDLLASPVMLFDFASDTFRDKEFEQVLQPDGSYVDGLPSPKATDYINELYQQRGMWWGE